MIGGRMIVYYLFVYHSHAPHINFWLIDLPRAKSACSDETYYANVSKAFRPREE